MIISHEQARRAAEYLRTSSQYASVTCEHDAVPAELLSRVIAALAATPDLREERVAEARERCGSDLPDSEDIASKLIGRLVSDAVR